MAVFPSSVTRKMRLTWPVIARFTWLLPLTTVFPPAEAGPAKGTQKAKSAAAATEVCRVGGLQRFCVHGVPPLCRDIGNIDFPPLVPEKPKKSPE